LTGACSKEKKMRSQHVTLPCLGVFSPISDGHLTPYSPWETKQITNTWRFHSITQSDAILQTRIAYTRAYKHITRFMFYDPGTYYFFIISDDIHSKRIGKSQLNTQYELVW